ncbi:helix-turn-helix domain-containing protein [Kitasatospora sp. NPDC059571]|uniref:helix-turn-helix domain-containing protein n=1 Tax=Kitasatospora sp. NPDC059571 TaxID=3346871 RepID=UPI0036ABDD22
MDTRRRRLPPVDDRWDTAELLRRIAARRTQLDLTEAELARRAGMSPRYLGHLLRTDTAFDPDALLRLAAVLGMTYRELAGDDPAGPPSPEPAVAHPVLVRLTEAECWDRLDTHGIGRVALAEAAAPGVYPVNYAVDGGTVVYRTATAGAAAAPTGTAVSFEADRLDSRHRNGWSVLLTGTARQVTDGEEDRRLAALVPSRPWAGGDRNLWIRIVPATVTGRLIRTP